jgi:uncharacterized heparinase superfamily protein
MPGAADIVRLFNTARHLRPVQVYGRVIFRLSRPSPDHAVAPALRQPAGSWVRPPERRQSMFGATRFRLLNVEHDLADVGWDESSVAKLWRYNQHYFDDLNAEGCASRTAWHRELLVRWVNDNPPATGTAWEPYPTSLRIVNWVKWMLAGNVLPDACVHSLAIQSRWLCRRLEWHLLGNHLFVNAKALVFAGCAFDGPEADDWLRQGTEILLEQIPEQILPDGGQFERSPMYHALALEDMLDLFNVLHRFPGRANALASVVERRITGMRRWLAAMCHPDGEVSFFNDSAIGVHPAPAELERYARELGFGEAEALTDGLTMLPDSGYARLQSGAAVAILDVGRVGPDYLPGHAHADTLSFELSLHARRILVNSGTSEYGIGPERLRQRGTAAHNSLTIDGEDSSEVWGGFRVARRARPLDLRLETGAEPSVSCGHDGYRRLHGSPIHRRRWRMTGHSLEIEDRADAAGRVRTHWHLGPGLRALPQGDGRSFVIDPVGAEFAFSGSMPSVAPSTWHPEFGVTVSNESVIAQPSGTTSSVRISWA